MKKLLSICIAGCVLVSCSELDATKVAQLNHIASLALTLKEGDLTKTQKLELTEQLIDSSLQLVSKETEVESSAK